MLHTTVSYCSLSSFFYSSFIRSFFKVSWTFRVNPKKGTKRKSNHYDFSDDPIGILLNNKKRKIKDTFFKSSEPSNLSGSETTHEFKEETFRNVNKKRGSRRSNIKVKTSNSKFDEHLLATSISDFSNITIKRGSRATNKVSRVDTETLSFKSPSNLEPVATEIASHILEPDLSKVTLKRGSRASDKSCHDCVPNDLFVTKKRGSRANHRTRQITNEPVIHADAFFHGSRTEEANNHHSNGEVIDSYQPNNLERKKTLDNRYMCKFCPKTYATNGKWLRNHEASHTNVDSFTRNNVKFNVGKGVKNFPKKTDVQFLRDFNLTPCDRNVRKEKLLDESAIFLDQGFSGKCQVNFKEKNVFEEAVSSYLRKCTNNLRISSLNINSLDAKLEDILFLLNGQMVDILVINESKLSEKNDDSIFQHACYDFYRRDRPRDIEKKGSGGGVVAYVKKNLNSCSVSMDDVSEIISFITNVDKQKIGVLACYRPPYSNNETSFFESVNKILTNLESQKVSETLIIGDLNFDVQDELDSHKLIDFNVTNNFTNTINKPTRLDPVSGKMTLLDVILCSNPTSVLSSAVFPYSRSDHWLIVSIFNFKSSKYKYCSMPSRCLNEKKMKLLKLEIKNIFQNYDLSRIINVNIRWNLLKDEIMKSLEKIAPIKQINVRITKSLPWYDKQLVNLAHKRNRLYNTWCKSKLAYDRAKYVEIRNKYNLLFRYKKSNHYKDFVADNSQSTRSFWQKLNPFLNPNKKQKISISILSNKENNIHSAQDLVNAFSNFFSSILCKFKFIRIDICKNYATDFFSKGPLHQLLQSKQEIVFDFGSTTRSIVESYLSKINVKTAPGSINIEARVFNECASELSMVFTDLFNLCLECSQIPYEWKIAQITPVYKGKGNKSHLDNYRPISIISPISKVFESVMGKKKLEIISNKTRSFTKIKMAFVKVVRVT